MYTSTYGWFSVGCRFINREGVQTRSCDNTNSPTLSFFSEIPAGTGGINDDLMRKYLLLLFTIGLFTGCSSDYDDGKLWDSVNDLENRLSALEKQCKEMTRTSNR